MITEIDEIPSIMVGDYKLQFELGEPCERTKEVALRELRETPENIKTATAELKKLLDGKSIYITQLYFLLPNQKNFIKLL